MFRIQTPQSPLRRRKSASEKAKPLHLLFRSQTRCCRLSSHCRKGRQSQHSFASATSLSSTVGKLPTSSPYEDRGLSEARTYQRLTHSFYQQTCLSIGLTYWFLPHRSGFD